jgi:hypothetical protein
VSRRRLELRTSLIKSQAQRGPEPNINKKAQPFSKPACFFFDNGRCMFCPGSGTERAQSIHRGRLTTHASEVKRPGMIQNTSWVPLQNTQGQRRILWAYDKDDPPWVVYRFVWTKPNMPDVVFYVGSGLNLSGPKLSGIKTPSGVHRGYRTAPASTLSAALSINF